MNKLKLSDYLLPKEPFLGRKKIWFFWDSGIVNAPDIVKISYSNWKQMNPDYEVILLNNENCTQKTGFNFQSCFENATAQTGTAGKTDFLRLYLLYHWGGVWVDATTFCLEPLSKWLKINDESPFFCFKQPINCTDRQLVSWFLSSKPKNPLVEFMLKETYSYLFKNRDYPIKIGPVAAADQDKYPELVSRKDTGKAYLEMEESRGQVPYFWMFYLFNDAIKVADLGKCFEELDPSTNKHCRPRESFSHFEQSYVSKQSYRINIGEFKDKIMFLKKNNMLDSYGDILANKIMDIMS
ncbi:MAG: capsular polysaccharide synthesis protein [Methylococcaceae bacterium]|nr:capsular polysaccharide synthesis protein [Methylococcaceae bacterium]